jgi:hypothetical protein
MTEKGGPGVWIAFASVVLLLLALAGLFVLILLGVPGDLLAFWLTALSTVAAFTLAATGSQRSKSDGDPPE